MSATTPGQRSGPRLFDLLPAALRERDAVAGDPGFLHAEIGGAMLHEHVELLERTLVQKDVDAFACRQLAALVLCIDTRLAAAHAGALAPDFELVENFLHDPSVPPVLTTA